MPAVVAAIADEGWSELVALSTDAKRKHIHWTHIRTHDPSHKQPSAFTRQEFWEHMVRVYKEVYPEPANSSGSILLFGLVAKERHAEAADDELREEHHHAPCYCSRAHRWRQVAKRSLEHHGVKLHAACHEGYTSMYRYVRQPSSKKPLWEIDAEPFLSDEHPRGELLERLLVVGERSTQIRMGGRVGARAVGQRGAGADGVPPRRMRQSDVYDLAKSHSIRTVQDLQIHANALARDGDESLAHFCTSAGNRRLQELLAAAWAVLEAPERARVARMTLLDILRERAQPEACVCGGTWPNDAA